MGAKSFNKNFQNFSGTSKIFAKTWPKSTTPLKTNSPSSSTLRNPKRCSSQPRSTTSNLFAMETTSSYWSPWKTAAFPNYGNSFQLVDTPKSKPWKRAVSPRLNWSWPRTCCFWWPEVLTSIFHAVSLWARFCGSGSMKNYKY